MKTFKLIAEIQTGTLECEVKGSVINMDQLSGKSLLKPVGGIYRNKVTATGNGAQVKYGDGDDSLEAGERPAQNDVESFMLEEDGGITFDDSVEAPADDRESGADSDTPEPPQDPEGPDRGDISPH